MHTFIFLGLLILQNDWELANQIDLTRFKENIEFSNYDISQTYKLNDSDYILIGKDKVQNIDNEGYRLLYLLRYKESDQFSIEYISHNKGEVYAYAPYFFKFSDDELIIIAEERFEYMSGIDVFKLQENELEFLGYIPVSGPNRDSVIK